MANTIEKIENKVIDDIAEASSGKLTVFKPQGLLGVADLAVKKRAEYGDTREIYIKIKPCDKDEEGKHYISHVPAGEFEENADFYMLFLHFDIVSQGFGEYIWLVPTEKFAEISAAASLKSKVKVFEFSVPVDPREDSEYSKYLIKAKDLSKILAMIIEKGSSFVFPEVGFSGIERMTPEDIKKFIMEARANTFAGNAPALDNPRLRGSKEFEFQKGDWAYQDIYFSGKKNLIGQEVVYHATKPIWSMIYFGDQIDEKTNTFLKDVLLEGVEKCRFGENYEKKRREFVYIDAGEGTIERFQGKEEIQLAGKTTYKLTYQGGVISK